MSKKSFIKTKNFGIRLLITFISLLFINTKNNYSLNINNINKIHNNFTLFQNFSNILPIKFSENLLTHLNFTDDYGICKFQTKEKNKLCNEIIKKFYDFIINVSNISIVNDYIFNEPACKVQFMNLLSDFYNNFIKFFSFSGKNLGDIGLEKDCEENNFTFFIIQIHLNNTIFYQNSETELLAYFLEIEKFPVGICFLNNCTNFFNNFLNKDFNLLLFNYLKKEGIENVEVISKKIHELDFKFIIICYIFIFYLIFKLICSFLFYFTNSKRKNTLDYKIPLDNYKNEYSDLNLYSKTHLDRDDSFLHRNPTNLRYKNGKTKFQNLINIFHEFFSFVTNFYNLTEVKNEYFNDNLIESLGFYKLLMCFLITFNHIFYTFVILPHENFYNDQIYYSFKFGLLKLTIYGLDCYIILEALTFSYKLMNYTKLHGTKLKSFFKFYIYSIPKILLFLTIYFIFTIQFEIIGNYFGVNTIFNNILIHKLKSKECFHEGMSTIIFDYFNFCYGENENKFLKCFKFTYVYINMFFCYNFFMIVFYFSFKLKKKIFDFIISFFILIFFITAPLNFDILEYKKYTFNVVLGELLSFKFPHLFLIKYFIGVLAGLFYFYSNETILCKSIINTDNYLPFSYVYDYLVFINVKQNYFFMKIFSHQSCKSRRFILILFSILTQILFAVYNFVNFLVTERDLYVDFSIDFRIIFYYERYIFGFAFIIMITCMSLTKNNIVLKSIRDSKLFLLFGRINLTYFCISDNIVYIFFTMYDIQLYFTYQNILFITWGLTFIIFFISFFIVYLFELPIRKLIKIIKIKYF